MKEIFGKITLINDNCMNVLRELPDKDFDLAIVDPPYFQGPNKRKYYGCEVNKLNIRRKDYPVIESWEVPTAEYFNEVFRVSKHQIVWGVNYYDFKFSPGRIIWDKCNGESSFSDAEIANTSIHDSVRLFRYMWNGMLQGKSISEGHIMQGNKSLNEFRIHPTQKPVALYKWLLMNYAKEGRTILDTHLGSGSICIACHDLGFEMTGIELDKEYYEAAKRRLVDHQRQQKLS